MIYTLMTVFTVRSYLITQQAKSKGAWQLGGNAFIRYFEIVSAESCIDLSVVLSASVSSNFTDNFIRFSCKFDNRQWDAN